MGGNFEFQVQDSFFGIFFLGDLKNESHFLKKSHLQQQSLSSNSNLHPLDGSILDQEMLISLYSYPNGKTSARQNLMQANFSWLVLVAKLPMVVIFTPFQLQAKKMLIYLLWFLILVLLFVLFKVFCTSSYHFGCGSKI